MLYIGYCSSLFQRIVKHPINFKPPRSINLAPGSYFREKRFEYLDSLYNIRKKKPKEWEHEINFDKKCNDTLNKFQERIGAITEQMESKVELFQQLDEDMEIDNVERNNKQHKSLSYRRVKYEYCLSTLYKACQKS